MDPRTLFPRFNDLLKEANFPRELYVCGGAALICLGWVNRQTRDVDVILPELDPLILGLASQLAKENNLDPAWLNNAVATLAESLPPGWGSRTVSIFSGSHLEVKALGRMDLIRTKLYAACDRMDDVSDLVAMKVTPAELEETGVWVLAQDASELWPQILSECKAEVLKRTKSKAGN